MFGIHLLPSNHWQNFDVLLEWTPPKSGKHMSIRMIHWSNPFRCCLENFRFLSPVFMDSRGAVDTNCWQMLPVASEDFAVRFGSMFCRWDADLRLCGGHHSMCTRTTMGRDLKQRQLMYHFFLDSNDIFFKKWSNIDFGYFCQNINFGLQFLVVLEDVFLRPSVWISCPKHWIRAWNLSWLEMLQVTRWAPVTSSM